MFQSLWKQIQFTLTYDTQNSLGTFMGCYTFEICPYVINMSCTYHLPYYSFVKRGTVHFVFLCQYQLFFTFLIETIRLWYFTKIINQIMDIMVGVH